MYIFTAEEMLFNRIHANKYRLLKHWLSCSAAVVPSCHYLLDITLDYIIPKRDLNYNTYQFWPFLFHHGNGRGFSISKAVQQIDSLHHLCMRAASQKHLHETFITKLNP